MIKDILVPNILGTKFASFVCIAVAIANPSCEIES